MKRSTFFAFIGPSVLVMTALMIVPLISSLFLSFHYITFRSLDEPVWVGFRNYVEVMQDAEFWDSLIFTLIFIAVTVPARIFLGLVLALLLDQIVRFRGVFIAGALLPFVLTPVVGTLIFRDMFDRGGLYWWGIQQLFDYRMFFDTATVRSLLIFHTIWVATPFAMIVLFAGLQTVPQEALEAARVDGANWLRQLWHIVLPHLRSLFIFIGLISVMDSYRVFDSVFVLVQGNSNVDAETIMYYNFQVALSFGRLGKANAISVLTVIGIFIVLVPFLLLTYREQLRDA